MASYQNSKYPELLVRFADGSRVKFSGGSVEVEGDQAKRLDEFGKRHEDYGIVKTGESAPGKPRSNAPKSPFAGMRKADLQAEARAHNLDDSGTVAEIRARLEGAPVEPDEDSDQDDDQDDDQGDGSEGDDEPDA